MWGEECHFGLLLVYGEGRAWFLDAEAVLGPYVVETQLAVQWGQISIKIHMN